MASELAAIWVAKFGVPTSARSRSDTRWDYPDVAGHVAEDTGPMLRPIYSRFVDGRAQAITADGVYKIVRAYSVALGFQIGPHALRATAATNALDLQADIAKSQEWLGHANIATTLIYDHRKTLPEDRRTLKVAF